MSFPTELIELVEFLHHENPQIRAVAAQHLVGFSASSHPQNGIFRNDAFRPIKDLKVLICNALRPDQLSRKTAHDSLTCLVNLSTDPLVRSILIDEGFLKLLMGFITSREQGLADMFCMLLSNMAKSDDILKIMDVTMSPVEGVSTSTKAMDQLMDVFVKGAEKGLNEWANYDFLGNFFSDMTRFPQGRKYFLEKQEYDGVLPLSKVVVFTTHGSLIRRTGVASTIKNCCFDTSMHMGLLADEAANGVDILPFILLPLMGPEEYDDEDMDGMPDECQLLGDDKKRESDEGVMVALLDALLLLTTTRPARDLLRARKAYPIIRELHKAVEKEEVQAACERVVDILMREEPKEGEEEAAIEELESDEEDGKMVEV
ncbi:Protein hgh1 [Saitoella coloradoensis]